MRRISETSIGARALRAGMAGVLAVGLMPLPAFAQSYQATGASLDAQAASTDGYVIAAAYAAAEPAPEILGLNNPQYRSEGEAENVAAIFGQQTNTAPDPYLVNMLADETPSIIAGGRQGSPMSGLLPYNDVSDNGKISQQVWNLKPDIVLGTGSDAIPDNESTFYDTDDYARAAETANGWAANSYHPIGVTYNRTDLNTMVNTMYRLAIAAEKTVANSNGALQTRYESPLEIAKDYERYVTGTKGYALKNIANGKVKKKSVACIYSYDSSAGAFNILPNGVEQGTATQNRFLEAVQGVADNYFDLSTNPSYDLEVTTNRGSQTYNLKTVSIDDLKKDVDLIIMNTDASSGTDDACVAALNSAGLLSETFYGTDMSAGAVFGVSVNSVENAQNVGRILTCLYDEIFDQSDFVAYYYDTFYHIQSGSVADTVAEKMDGVRNWAVNDSSDATANLQWDAADVSDYTRSEVESIITEGMDYLRGLPTSKLPDAILTPTVYYTMNEADVVKTVEPDTETVATLGDDTKVETSIEDETWAASVISGTPAGAALGLDASEENVSDLSKAGKDSWQSYIDRGAEAVLGYDVDLYVVDSNNQPLKQLTSGLNIQVKLPVDAKHNGKSVEVTQVHNGKATVHPEATKVEDGFVTLDVTELSEFVVAIGELAPASETMLRLYNENSGEHFYTSDTAERDYLVEAGWKFEGEAWKAPATSSKPVYRVYNPNAGDHHYTMKTEERDYLTSNGWDDEGIGWYSDEAEGTPLLRLYNPNATAGSHHYTIETSERDYLVNAGWNDEGIGWYGLK